MSYRVRGFTGRIIFVVMLAVMIIGIIQTPTSWIFALTWAVTALLVELVEARVLARILKRRLVLTRVDQINATMMTAATGVTRAVCFAYLFLDFHTGSRILAVIIFFSMSVHYLRMFQGCCALYGAIIGPSLLTLTAGCFASLWMLDGNVVAAAVLVSATLLSFSQLIYASRAIYMHTRTIRQSRRNAETVAERADKAMKAKAEFLAVISHELRTPMNALLGSAELLRRTNLNTEQAEHMRSVQDSGTMLMTLLNDLLDASKIEAGALTAEVIPVNIRELLERELIMWRPRASDQGLALSLEVASEVPSWIVSDPMRLKQVLFNLLSNALKFTESGEVRIALEVVDAEGAAPQIAMSVSDTGVGVTPDVAARLFRPFEQADSSTARKYGGTGLGLSICKGIAEALNGKLSLDSVPGAGATFTLTFPLTEASEPGREPEQYGDLEIADSVRVLVAEDHAANRRLIGALLQPLGYEIAMACDGREAVEMFAAEHFDAIIMDMQMPEMDGAEATRTIRAMSERGAEIPIVALTANATEVDRQRCLDAGMNEFLTKPLDPRALHATLIRAVAMGQASPIIFGDEADDEDVSAARAA